MIGYPTIALGDMILKFAQGEGPEFPPHVFTAWTVVRAAPLLMSLSGFARRISQILNGLQSVRTNPPNFAIYFCEPFAQHTLSRH